MSYVLHVKYSAYLISSKELISILKRNSQSLGGSPCQYFFPVRLQSPVNQGKKEPQKIVILFLY